MASLQFSHIALNCQDPLEIERFYTRHFGFQRARVIPIDSGQIVFIKSGAIYLELFKAAGPRPAAPPSKDGYAFPGVRHLAFQVDDVDTKLAAMGADAKITLGPLDFDDVVKGWRTVWIADPEGNIIEISQGFTDQPNPPTLSC